MLYPDFNELMQMGRRSFQSTGLSKRDVLSSAPGDYASPFRGRGLDFEEVRKYMPGDDIRSIDWRVTARTNMPHMKIFTEERERTVILCVDSGANLRFGTRGTFKSIQAARAASLLGWSANRAHDKLGAVIYGDVPGGLQFFTPARSHRPLGRMLKLLSQKPVQHSAPATLETALDLLSRSAPTGSVIFIIAGFDMISSDLEKRLAYVRRRSDIVLVRLNDPADETIPPLGTIRFKDAGGAATHVNTDSVLGRKNYAAAWKKNREMLERIANRQQIGIIDIHTNRDVRKDLLPGLRRLGIRRGKP